MPAIYASLRDVEELIERYDLPELPEPAEEDDGELRELVLFLQPLDQDNIVLAEGIELADAQGYCSREDTHGDGWFVGFRH
jgi:hypothetical protein